MRLSRWVLIVLTLCPWVAAEAEQCEPTPTMVMGTHHKDGARFKVDISTGLFVSGRVLEAMTCRPIVGAKIEHWQTNTEGFYTDRLRAYLYSDVEGAYRFETEWPGAAVPHIHFIVSAEGYRTLVTQWVGKDPIAEIHLDLVLQPINE